MQKELGVKPKKDKSEKKREKEERKRLKQERKHGRDKHPRSPSPPSRRTDRDHSPPLIDRYRRNRSRSPRRYSPSRSRSPGPSRRREEDFRDYSRHHREPAPRRGRSTSRSPMRSSGTDSEDRFAAGPSSSKHNDARPSRHSPPRDYDHNKRSRSPSSRRRSPPPKRIRTEHSPIPSRSYDKAPPRSFNESDRHRTNADEARAARLAAMSSNANTISEDRQKRLAALLEREKAELEADERAREKSGGMSGFISQEQKRVFGGMGGLEDRIKRGRGGLVVDAD